MTTIFSLLFIIFANFIANNHSFICQTTIIPFAHNPRKSKTSDLPPSFLFLLFYGIVFSNSSICIHMHDNINLIQFHLKRLCRIASRIITTTMVTSGVRKRVRRWWCLWTRQLHVNILLCVSITCMYCIYIHIYYACVYCMYACTQYVRMNAYICNLTWSLLHKKKDIYIA